MVVYEDAGRRIARPGPRLSYVRYSPLSASTVHNKGPPGSVGRMATLLWVLSAEPLLVHPYPPPGLHERRLDRGVGVPQAQM